MRISRKLPLLFVSGLLLIVLAFVPTASAAHIELTSSEVAAVNKDGSPDSQAGSHPYSLNTSLVLNQPEEFEPKNPNLVRPAAGGLKDVRVELPPGFVGNPNATPKCSYHEFTERACPDDTAIGEATTTLSGIEKGTFNNNTAPVYNIETPGGMPAEFGYRVKNFVPIFLDATVRTGGDYGITVNVGNILEVLPIYATKVKIWGVPADPAHDPLRGKCLGEGEDKVPKEEESRGICPANVSQQPLLTNPTSCGTPRVATLSVDAWGEPGSFFTGTAPLPALTGCEKLDFSPSFTVAPDGTAGSTPTGLNIDEHIPQESTVNPVGLAEADVKNTTVTLPAGVQLSPSAADGLTSCSEAQVGLHEAGASSCPDSSKVANVEIDTPLLPEPLTGAVYLATQEANPFGSLIALYIVAENKPYGVRIKVAGQVTPNPVTGQLVTTFKETPPLPFSDLKLKFFGTARAPLTTPALCGSYRTEAVVEPWSGTPAVEPVSSFQITSGPGGAPCSNPQPFTPGFQSGSLNLQAGAFTPFELTMTRPDADQTLSRVEMQMPPGLLGTLAHVALCPEPQASQGTCGPDSLIGETIVSAGLGNSPYAVTGGKVYITTGYKGAPYGLSIVNPAKAGPFDLEANTPCDCVVVRASVSVDVHTAALTIKSDPLPTIIDGIPLQIQHVNVSVNRKLFTFNPTNCNKTAINGTLTSTEGATAAVSTSFQVTNCAKLAFKPKLTAKTSGKTSRTKGASLSVKLTYPAGPYDANIAKVKVALPKQLPSRLTTLQKACPAATFEANPANCPAASIIGHATATTPVMPVPLTGPAYFVSHGGEAFPSLIIVLQGYGATVELVGTTFISKTGITSSTFKTIPDVPVGTFEMTLPQGQYSALGANANLCKVKGGLHMPTAFVGQNGAEIHTSTPVGVTGCPKPKKAKKK
jgi:hypothetical protein